MDSLRNPNHFQVFVDFGLSPYSFMEFWRNPPLFSITEFEIWGVRLVFPRKLPNGFLKEFQPNSIF